MNRTEWERLYEVLKREYEGFQEANVQSVKGRTYKIRKLGARNVDYGLGRVRYYIINNFNKEPRVLLEQYLADKRCSTDDFFLPTIFLNYMQGFLRFIAEKLAELET